ncbi:hypothetical protein SDC9_94257 [bioreactor metagenome]|uniref:Uncharacterized protein n=1 Tax=bioreactor metagenome TaxID=1076179 RepID=A0A645A3N3_9ZZZZ
MHKLVDVGGLGGGGDLVLGSVRLAVGDVLADGAAEQPGVLQDHAERLAQCRAGDRRDVGVVDTDLSAVDLVEPLQQVHQSRLAGTGRSDDRDRLAGQRLHVQALDQRVVR